MSDETPLNQVNSHYLDKVMDLAEVMDVEAAEDIFDARGMKLVAKGAKISRNLQERLIMHKLRKPLESSIAVEGGVSTESLLEEATRLLETIEPLCCLHQATARFGSSPQGILKQAKFGNSMSMMLTIVARGGSNALVHSLMVSLVSICLAKKLKLSESDQSAIALAGLLHDIGELYIEPQYLQDTRHLLPHDWRHVAVHPFIGRMLINELERCPPTVAQAAAEHHERFDGGGYPRHISGSSISPFGQILSVSEMISGVFMSKDKPLMRAELALKIIPGEHAPELVSAVSEAMHISKAAFDHAAQLSTVEATCTNVRQLFNSIDSVLRAGQELASASTIKSQSGMDLLAHMLHRVNGIKRAFSSTGLDVFLDKPVGVLDSGTEEIQFEVDIASREIHWRLRDIGRNLALHTESFPADEILAFQPLITTLDQGVQ